MSASGIEDYQALADGMNQLLYARVAAASPVETLSTHNGKLLQVVEAESGERFVTRSYTHEAIEEIEGNYGIDFRTAWEEMHEAFSGVGIEVVPSRLIETDGEYPFIVVSEYLQDGQSLATASSETKVAVTKGLAELLATDGWYIPAPEMVRDDMFLVVERDGEATALLADVDPLMAHAHRIQRSDPNSAFYIDKLAELAWDRWGNEEDRVAITSALVSTLGDFALDKFDLESATSRAFMDLHLMSNGVDNRGTWSGV